MRVRRPLVLKIAERIQSSSDAVFLTREFSDLSDERQVLRALRQLVDEGKIIRVGYGVYTRAEPSAITGTPVMATPGGFGVVARRALTKLGVDWQPTQQETDYVQGKSTQIPVNTVLRIKSRFNRKLYNGKRPLILEKAT